MSEISVAKQMVAPRSSVWSVLADFPNIADWNGGVTKSFSTSTSVEGVGAQRHCDLKPFGALEETISAWEPEHRMVIDIESAAKLPIRRGAATFTIDGDDDAPVVRVDYAYEPKFGVVGRMISPLLDRQLSSGFSGFLDDLETEAASRASDSSGG